MAPCCCAARGRSLANNPPDVRAVETHLVSEHRNHQGARFAALEHEGTDLVARRECPRRRGSHRPGAGEVSLDPNT